MTTALFRTVILYLALMVGLRLLGKRQIGELEPSELVLTLIISDLAAVPMQDFGIPLVNGLLPIVTLLCLSLLLSFLNLKSVRLRSLLCGRPTAIIREGKLLQKEMAKNRLTVDELLAHHLSPENFAALAEEDEVYREVPNAKQRDYICRLVRGVDQHAGELDTDIDRYAKGWKFSRMALGATAIMRVAMYEILYMPDIPNGAAINEAVELARKYEGDEVAKFVNGILGAFVRAEVKE